MVILEKENALAKNGAFFDNFNKLLNSADGKALKESFWGERKFSYPIRKLEKGVYTVIEFECPPAKIKAIEGKLKLEKGVVRYMISQRSKGKSQK